LADSSKKLAWPLINSIPLCFMRSPMALVHAVPHPGVHVSRDKLSRENLSNETTGQQKTLSAAGQRFEPIS